MSTESFIENIFSLPGGLMLQQGQLLKQASLRPLTGCEEEWLAHHRSTPNAVRVSWLLSHCLLSVDGHLADSDLVGRLLIADRQYLMLQLRRLTLGEQIQAVVPCPACNQKMDIDFRLDDVAVEFRPQRDSSYSVEVSGRTVCFRLPTGRDEEAVLGNETDNAVQELLRRCILDNGGSELSLEEQEAVIAEMERLAPEVELELDLTCPECAHHFVLPFDLTAFFFDEMAFKSEELLREIHALAFYYHWSEGEILKLDRRRRRAYLALLNESLRQDWAS